MGKIKLPYKYPNGGEVFLGDEGIGYPPELYPNLTYIDGPRNVSKVAYQAKILHFDSVLILGPLDLTESSSLMSISVAICNQTNSDILAWLTVVVDAQPLYDILASPEGLDTTGENLIIGPTTNDNLFAYEANGAPAAINSNMDVYYVFPPASNKTLGNRHALRAYDTGNPNLPFSMGHFPAVVDAWSTTNHQTNNAGSRISTSNEEGVRVSVGYAQIASSWVNWILIFEQSYDEVVAPIHHFRDVVLASIFSVMGGIILVCLPLAHYAVRPIRALRDTTKRAVKLYPETTDTQDCGGLAEKDKKRDWVFRGLNHNEDSDLQTETLSSLCYTETSQIPQRVPEGRHLFHDELTDLTKTFNEMSDKLVIEYSRLEERVRLRTTELELSRNSAQKANESKTLFVANMSHELRTPLNGILGMCAIALHEREESRVQEALKIIYNSGDLLLHLLNDLLTFSQNSYGQQLTIEQEPFRLSEIGTQINAIFEKQTQDSQIGLVISYSGPMTDATALPEEKVQSLCRDDSAETKARGVTGYLANAPGGIGRVRDMSLLGDKHRIIQILMNLVSNSFKFTPKGGSIEVRIRYVGQILNHMATLSRVVTSQTLIREDSSAGHTNLLSPTIVDAKPVATPSNLLFEFEVQDTGQGIPEHLQQEIFKPFVQGDLTLSKKHGGTGLGLAICSQLATLMQGKIALRSTLGVGSTFTLSLSLPYLRERAPSTSTSVAASFSKLSTSKPTETRDTNVPSTPRKVLETPLSSPDQRKRSASIGQDTVVSPRATMTPIHSRRSSPGATAKNQSGSADIIRALVAEDNKVNQQVILRMLKLEGVTGKFISPIGFSRGANTFHRCAGCPRRARSI